MQQKEGMTPEITYVITPIGPDPSSDCPRYVDGLNSLGLH